MPNGNGNARRNRTAEDAAVDWMNAKNAETEANRKRIEAEDELVKLLGAKSEGAQSHQIGPYKITITGKLNRKMDFDALDALKIDDKLLPVRMKPEIDLKGLRYLEDKEPRIYEKIASKALTIEPAKTSVTVIRTEA